MIYNRKNSPLVYNKWRRMKTSCYNPNSWIISPHYQGCTVHDDWKDSFQQFAEDVVSMVGYGLSNRHLDKDILFKGNKVYSKDTCVLVPLEINILLTNCKNARGQLPIGVSYDGSKSPSYRVRFKKYGKHVDGGRYHTQEEAFLAYKHMKEEHIKVVTNLYRNEIDSRTYDALMNWTISTYD